MYDSYEYFNNLRNDIDNIVAEIIEILVGF